MSFSIALDRAIPDFRIRDGRIVLARGSDSVRDRIYTALQTELGEWFLDVTQGVPYYGDDGILGSKMQADQIGAIIRRRILADPDVVQINALNFDRGDNRHYALSVDCLVRRTDFDGNQTVEQISIEVL